MTTRRSELWVGATVLTAVAIFLYASFRLDGCAWFEPGGRHFVAHFDDAAGVVPRTAVEIAGVRVGQVERLELEGGRARLVLRIEDPSVRIPIDSTVEIRSRGLIGERVVEIVPGQSSQLASDGDTLTHTVDAPNLDRMMDRLAAVADDVKAVTHSLRLVVGGPEGEASLAETLENVRVASADIRKFVEENQDRMASTLGDIQQFSSDLAHITHDNRQTVGEMLRNFDRASQRMNMALAQLAQTTARINRGEGTLGKLTKDDKLYKKAEASLDDLQKSLAEVRRAAEQAQEQLPVTVLGSVVGTLF